MKKFYCNGKKGFCDRYNGETETSCFSCEFCDGTGGEFIENITNYDRIRNMSVEEMAEMITALFHEEHLKLATRLKENGIDCTLVEADHDLQVAIHQNWLESEVTGNG